MIILTEQNSGKEFVIEAYNRKQLLDMLKSGPALISFKKVTNDRYRLLFGTRDLSRIPGDKHPTGQGLPFDPAAKDLIPIFDLVKGEWRSFKVRRVRKAAQKTDAFLRRLLQSKKIQDRLRRRKFKKDSGAPNDSAMGEGVSYGEYQTLIAEADVVIEAVEIPTFLEDNINFSLNEYHNAWLIRSTEWLKRNKYCLPDVAERALKKFSTEDSAFAECAKKVLRGEDGYDPDLNEEVKKFLRDIDMTAITYFPEPSSMSTLTVGLLRVVESMTSIPVFPKSWENEPEPEHKPMVSFKEMAAGPIGDGASSAVDPDTFKRVVRTSLVIINSDLARGVKPIDLGNTKGGRTYIIGTDFGGIVIASDSADSFIDMMDDHNSVTFVSKYFTEDDHKVTDSPVVSIQNPYTRKDKAGQGIAFDIYKAVGREYDVMADNTQSKEGRFLWAKLVRDKAFPYIYVYNELADEVEEEIAGNLDRFRELMAEGDAEIRFIGSIRKI